MSDVEGGLFPLFPIFPIVAGITVALQIYLELSMFLDD
jgi:hypothetical protein